MGKTDIDKEKFEQYKRDHPDLYYPAPELNNPVARVGYKASVGMGINSLYYFKRFFANYGFKFFVTLSSTYIGVKGFLYTCINTSQTPYYQQYLGVALVDMNVYGNISRGPWSMKGFFGVVSDLIPIGGWRKRWWCVLACLMGSVAWLTLAFFPITKDSAMIAAFMFFFCHCQIASNDLLVEGQYAEMMRKNPFSGADIVTWVWMSYFIGSLSANWLVGPFADMYEESQDFKYLRYILLISLPLAAQNAIPFLFNWLGETRLPAGKRGFQSEQWNGKNKPLYTVALVMGFCALLNVVANVLLGSKLRSYISKDLGYPRLSMLPMLAWSLVVGAFLIAFTFKYLPRVVAKANTYQFISRGAYISIYGLDAWFLAKDDCIPDGPKLDNKFLTTYMGTVEAIFGGLGVACFQAIMGDWCFRPCFWVTTALQSVGAVWDCVIFMRWNIAVGIPDKFSLMMGNAVIREIVGMMDFMPGVILTSKLCPKGAESTMYAILAGFANFGRAIGGNFGAIVVPMTGLEIDLRNAENCNDAPLVMLTFFGQAVFPLISIPFTWWLIPDARLTGTIIDEFGNEYPPADLNENEDSEDIEAVESKEVPEIYEAPVAVDAQAPVYDPYAQFQPAYTQQPAYTVPSSTPQYTQ